MDAENTGLGRRKFLNKIATIGAVACLPLPEIALAQGSNEDDLFVTPPYLQNLSSSKVTIMWITKHNSVSWVEFEETDGTKHTVYASKNGLVTKGCIQKVKLSKLAPSKTYKYTIYSKEITSAESAKVTYGKTLSKSGYSFATLGKKNEEVSFIVLNDMHNRPDSIRHLLKNYTKENEYDFAVLNGDMFNHIDGEEKIVSDLLLPLSEYFSTQKPFLMVQGNHEVRGSYARQFFEYFDYKDERSYYAFTQGPIRFVVLDTGEDKEDAHSAYSGLIAFDPYREEQAEWLKHEIERPEFKKAPFRVVLMHIPVFYSGDWHGTTHCRQLFNPLFNKGKVDLVISGHTHRYGTFNPDPGNHSYSIMIGGAPQAGNRTIMKARADRKNLSIQMLRDDGKQVGKFDLKRR